MKIYSIALMLTGLSLNSHAFDMGDYDTTRRATRDAFFEAQKTFADSKNAYDDYSNLLKENCLQIIDSSTFSMANVSGLMNGACNCDGQGSHASGGVLPTSGNAKLGDKIARIIELLPAPAAKNIDDIKILGRFSDLELALRTKRDADLVSRMTAVNASNVTISTLSQCSGESTVVTKWKAAGATNTTLINRYKALRTDLITKATDLKRATNSYIAAKNAYRGSSMVYLKSLGCTNTGANTIRMRYDPFVPEWPKVTGLKSRD